LESGVHNGEVVLDAPLAGDLLQGCFKAEGRIVWAVGDAGDDGVFSGRTSTAFRGISGLVTFLNETTGTGIILDVHHSSIEAHPFVMGFASNIIMPDRAP
jgi:hypothetical protein